MNTTDGQHRIAAHSRRADGFARQAPRRAAEDAARRHAVTLCGELVGQGQRIHRVAQRMHLSRRTLYRWRCGCHQACLPLPRGRPCKQSPYAQRLEILQWLDREGPHLGLPSLRAAFPEMPRCELCELQLAYRQDFQATHRRVAEELTWHRPNCVWAMDHVEPPLPIDDRYDAILSVRDLASGMQLAWQPVVDQTADATLAALTPLLEEHGPPLLIKSDNGSAFKSQALEELLAARQIVWLPSPPRTPWYNGGCEAANHSMKLRTRYFAANRGSARHWTCSDLEQTMRQANELARPQGHLGPTPLDRWQQRAPITQRQRAELSAAIEKHRKKVIDELPEPFDPNNRRQQHQVHRQAVRSALLQLGLLTITRRSIPLPLRPQKWDKIS